MKKSQVAVEYLVILGVALVLLLPVIALFYRSSIDSRNVADSNLIVVAGDKITTNAEKVFYQSQNSKLQLELNFPNNVVSVSTGTDNKTLVISAEYEGQVSDFLFFTTVPIFMGNCSSQNPVGNLSVGPGPNSVVVYSCGKNVSIYTK